MHRWQIQEAKARLSEVVKCAQQEGPQEITSHGQSVAVLLSREMFEQLAGTQQSFVEFMLQSPLHGLEDLVFERDNSLTRDIPL